MYLKLILIYFQHTLIINIKTNAHGYPPLGARCLSVANLFLPWTHFIYLWYAY